jgi:hypothetical protein
MRWAGHVAHEGEKKTISKIFVAKLEGRKHLNELTH